MAEFPIPSFLENQDLESVHKRMIERLPKDIDTSVGSHPYNLTRPVAYEMAYLMESVLSEAIGMIFPKYCEDYDEVLDDHAELRGLTRKAAEYATGTVTVVGKVGTEIPAGEVFETLSTNNDEEETVEFEVIASEVIPASGTVDVEVMAVDAGASGNVAPNTIVFTDLDDIESITNAEATVGGTDEETNESLQRRIMEFDRTQGNSFVGNVTDYKRWAEEVSGVGNATIISPTIGGNPVRIILTDYDGEPVDLETEMDVYNHIMGVKEDGSDRLAPINATINVETPATTAFVASAIIVLDTRYTLSDMNVIVADFVERLKKYMTEAPGDGEIKYSRVARCLSETIGIADYNNLLIGLEDETPGTENILITDSDYVEVMAENISLTTGA